MSRRLPAVLLTAVLLVLASVSVASAAPGPTSGVHFTRNGAPTCEVVNAGASATTDCTAELAGLGEGDVTLRTEVAGEAVYQCENKGGNIAPGQNTVLVGPAVDETVVPGGQIKNGRARLSTDPATLTAPATATAAEAGCPNPNWTGVNPDLNVTSVTFSATQGGVLVFSCTRTGDDLTGTFTLTDCEGAAA